MGCIHTSGVLGGFHKLVGVSSARRAAVRCFPCLPQPGRDEEERRPGEGAGLRARLAHASVVLGAGGGWPSENTCYQRVLGHDLILLKDCGLFSESSGSQPGGFSKMTFHKAHGVGKDTV